MKTAVRHCFGVAPRSSSGGVWSRIRSSLGTLRWSVAFRNPGYSVARMSSLTVVQGEVSTKLRNIVSFRRPRSSVAQMSGYTVVLSSVSLRRPCYSAGQTSWYTVVFSRVCLRRPCYSVPQMSCYTVVFSRVCCALGSKLPGYAVFRIMVVPLYFHGLVECIVMNNCLSVS